MTPISPEAQKQLFTEAHTQNGWLDEPVSDASLRELYDLMKWAPTCVNGAPLRILFLKKGNKEKLLPSLLPKNVEKTRDAPITAILAEDLQWHENLPKLSPHTDYYSGFKGNQPLIEKTAFRNSSMQGGYFILAARALGLDCGPMSGFNNALVDAAYFEGTALRSNFLCNLGHGNPAKVHPRGPRLTFDEACKVV